MAREVLESISRADLRLGCCSNLHAGWTEDPWVLSKVDLMVDRIKQLGVGLVRDAMFVHSTQTQMYYTKLHEAGVGLLLNVPEVRSGYVAEDVAYAALQPWAPSVRFFAGRNEPNSSGGAAWPSQTVAVQKMLYESVMAHLDKFTGLRGVLGPALKHEHVVDYDADLKAVAVAGIAQWTRWMTRSGPCLDMHFYPGIAGPIVNASEKIRAEAGYGAPVDWHSETGWPDDTPNLTPKMKARFCVEAYLRNRLNGFAATSLYQLSYDHTGNFGLVSPTGEFNEAGLAVKNLLNRVDGPPLDGEVWWAVDTPAKVPYVATTQDDGSITLYLMRGSIPVDVELITEPGYQVVGNLPNVGPKGNLHWKLSLLDTMHQIDFIRAA